MKKRTAEAFRNKLIDIHSHAGVSFKAYAKGEYPYAETIESLYYKQLAGGIDVNAVFPFTAELFCNMARLVETGEFVEADNPISPVPYELENRALLREVYEHCAELADRFLPFVCFDPGRYHDEQVVNLEQLVARYPVYGIKVLPILCQSPVIDLLDSPRFFEFAAEQDLPILFHTTPDPNETFSYAGNVFRVIDAHPGLRYCLAHGLLFHREFLAEADGRDNVWVDTAALKIQVEAFRSGVFEGLVAADYLDLDFTSHLSVMTRLCELYPETIVWGTDSPCYSYVVERPEGSGKTQRFELKGEYGDEVAALNVLAPEAKVRAGNTNALNFLFGPMKNIR